MLHGDSAQTSRVSRRFAFFCRLPFTRKVPSDSGTPAHPSTDKPCGVSRSPLISWHALISVRPETAEGISQRESTDKPCYARLLTCSPRHHQRRKNSWERRSPGGYFSMKNGVWASPNSGHL